MKFDFFSKLSQSHMKGTLKSFNRLTLQKLSFKTPKEIVELFVVDQSETSLQIGWNSSLADGMRVSMTLKGKVRPKLSLNQDEKLITIKNLLPGKQYTITAKVGFSEQNMCSFFIGSHNEPIRM